ncbi:MAG: lysylphosphatidylglycerol synthase transmembrane domain-containing protein [Nitrospirota bacterium]
MSSEPASGSFKKNLSLIVKLVVSSVLLLYLFYFSGIVDIKGVISTLKQTRLSIFIVAFVIHISAFFVAAKRWSLFLPYSLKYSRLVSLFFIGAFFNTFLPGLVGGDAVKAFYLYKDTGKGGISIVSVFMDRYMGFAAMVCIGLIAFTGGYFYIKGTEIVWFIPILCGGFLLASFILWYINWGRIKFLSVFYSPLMEIKSKKRIIYKGLLFALIVQMLSITGVYILSLAIGLKVPPVYFFIFVPIINAISAIPISIAGLGLREASFAALFSTVFAKVGVTPVQATGLSLLTFATMCLVNLIGGVEYLRIGKPPEKIADEHR